MQTPCLFRRSRQRLGRPWSARSRGSSRRLWRGQGAPRLPSPLSSCETAQFPSLFTACVFFFFPFLFFFPLCDGDARGPLTDSEGG